MSRKDAKVWLILLPVLVALTLRLGTLGRKSLWLDELETIRIARLETEEIISGKSDQNPPIYHILMHYWIGLGQSETPLRLPTALAGAVAIPLLYRLVREWSTRWAAMASAWLLTIAPLHIWYSQDARTYALVCTFGLVSTLCYTLAIRRGKPLIWLAWIVATLAGSYAHYSMLLLVFAQVGLLGLLYRATGSPPAVLWTALIALVIAALLFFPQARTFATQLMLSGWGGGYYYLAAQSLLSRLSISVSPSQFYRVVILASTVGLGAVMALVRILVDLARRTQVGTGPVLIAMIAYLLILVATIMPRGLGLKRQLLVLFPYVLGGIAFIISKCEHRLCLLVGFVVITLPLTGYTVLAQQQEAWRDVAHSIEQLEEPHDIILINASYSKKALDRYYHGGVPYQGIGPKDVPHVLQEITGSYGRVWLVLSHDRFTDPQGEVQAWFDRNCTLLNERPHPGIRVRLYHTERPSD